MAESFNGSLHLNATALANFAEKVDEEGQPGVKDSPGTDLVFAYIILVSMFGAFFAIVVADVRRKYLTSKPQKKDADKRNVLTEAFDKLYAKLNSGNDCFSRLVSKKKKKNANDIENVAEKNLDSQAIIERLAAKSHESEETAGLKMNEKDAVGITKIEVIVTPPESDGPITSISAPHDGATTDEQQQPGEDDDRRDSNTYSIDPSIIN